MTQSMRDFHLQQLSELKSQRSGFMPYWRDLTDFLDPTTSRYLITDRNHNTRNIRNTKIVNSRATLARETLVHGLSSGVTNPAQPWFMFKAEDPGLNTFRASKVYLDLVRERMATVFLRSNLYTQLPLTYAGIGSHGIDAFELLADPVTTVRCYGYPIGSYMLGANDRLVIDTAYREFQMTVGQLVQKFGLENCTDATKTAYRNKQYERWVTVVRAIHPNRDKTMNPVEAKNKAFLSAYWEWGSPADQYLKLSGFDSFPVIAPRWQAVGEDVYSTSCPGMRALGDVIQLQMEEKRKVTLVDKHNTPPMTAPSSMEKKLISNLPGGITYIDVMSGQQGMVPAYQTSLAGMQFLLEDIEKVGQRIDDAFYKNLFLMVSQLDREATAYEIAARQEEKLLALGPVYMRLNDELLDTTVNRTLEMMIEQSRPYWEGRLNGDPLLPPPPPELMGAKLTIQYNNVMSQAMKAVGINSIERTFTFAGSIQPAFPEVLDNLNADKAIIYYADVNGTPPDLLNDEQTVKQIRAGRAQQQQAQQAMAAAQQGSQVAKNLGTTPLSDNNALAQLLGRVQTPVPQGGQA